MDWIRHDGPLEVGSNCMLSAEATKHAAALRLEVGQSIGLLDGQGAKACGQVVVSRVREVRVRIDTLSLEPPPPDVTMCIGILDNRDRMEFAIEKCTELGIRRIVLLDCHRSQRHRIRIDRLEHKAESALLQSGNAWMPVIQGPQTVHACISEMPSGACIVVGDEHGVPPHHVTTPVYIMVGPEGGFTDDEQSAIAGAHRFTWRVGSSRLRTETAAITLAAAVVMNM